MKSGLRTFARAKQGEKFMVPMRLQFFAEGEETGEENNNNEIIGNAIGGEPPVEDKIKIGPDNSSKTLENIDKLVQSKVDRITAELGKKNAALQKQIAVLQKEKMTDEEIKRIDITEKETLLADREKALKDKENRLFAIQAIKKSGLDDGSDNSLKLVDFVLAEDEKGITERVTAFSELVKGFVAAEVDKTFKKNGRNPQQEGNKTGQGEATLAERLGKQSAEQNKKSNDILKMYLGGKE